MPHTHADFSACSGRQGRLINDYARSLPRSQQSLHLRAEAKSSPHLPGIFEVGLTHSPPLSPSLLQLQPHCPRPSSSNLPGRVPPQDLCTYFSLCPTRFALAFMRPMPSDWTFLSPSCLYSTSCHFCRRCADGSFSDCSCLGRCQLPTLRCIPPPPTTLIYFSYCGHFPESSGAGIFLCLGHYCTVDCCSGAWHTVGAQYLLTELINALAHWQLSVLPPPSLAFSRVRTQAGGQGATTSRRQARPALAGTGMTCPRTMGGSTDTDSVFERRPVSLG